MADVKQKCKVCKKNKPLTQFGLASTCANGRRKKCKACLSKKASKHYFKNKEIYALRNRKNQLLKLGVTIEQYEYMLKEQQGLCAICRRINRDGRRLAVDHCHKTGNIRGLLCDSCNTGLGKLGDTIESIENTLRYLKGEKPWLT